MRKRLFFLLFLVSLLVMGATSSSWNIPKGSGGVGDSGNTTGSGTPNQLSLWMTNSSLGDSNISWTGAEWDFGGIILVDGISSGGGGAHSITWDYLYMHDNSIQSVLSPLILDGNEDVYIQKNGVYLANFSDGEINFNGLKSGEGVVVISSLDDEGTLLYAYAQAEDYYSCNGGSFYHFGLGSTCQANDVYRIDKVTGKTNFTKATFVNDALSVAKDITTSASVFATTGMFTSAGAINISNGDVNILKGRIVQKASASSSGNLFADFINASGGVNTTILRATGAVTLLSTLTATSAASSLQAVTASGTLVVTDLTTLNGGARSAQGFNTTNLKANGTINFTTHDVHINLGATSGYVCYNATTREINISTVVCPI